MRKVFLTFCALFLANVSVGWGAYFYADGVEQAIRETFPENFQSVVAEEYEAQMNPQTGEIDEQGIYNVCYAGGFDVSTVIGAEQCADFVGALADKCVYTKGDSLKYYNNPTTREEKIRKCVFTKAIDLALSYEGGLQQNINDPGSRVCDEKGKPELDENGHYKRGATNFGITTCYTRFSVDCVKRMTKQDAINYYWTYLFYGYKYYTLPGDAMAAVMQLAVGGVGKVAKELKQAVGATHCSNVVIDDCIRNAVSKYIVANGADKFYDTICNLRAKSFARGTNLWQRAIDTKKLSSAYTDCAAKYK